MNVEPFLRTFFASPNHIVYERLETYSVHGNLRHRVQQLLEDPPRATVLPFVYEDSSGKVWHLNYALAFSESQFRQLGSDLQAFVGPTYAGFVLQRATLNRDIPIQRAVLELTGGFAYRFFSPTDPELNRRFLSSLELMSRVTSRARVRRYDLHRSTGRILRDFYVALEAGDRSGAEFLIQELRDHARLDALNLTFLRIQLLSRLGASKELMELPNIADVLRLRRPPLVTGALVEAVYNVNIGRFEREGDAFGSCYHISRAGSTKVWFSLSFPSNSVASRSDQKRHALRRSFGTFTTRITRSHTRCWLARPRRSVMVGETSRPPSTRNSHVTQPS